MKSAKQKSCFLLGLNYYHLYQETCITRKKEKKPPPQPPPKNPKAKTKHV